jgi:hypothetical protein
MEQKNIEKLSRFRKWLIIQKYIMQRGYGWTQVPLLGFIGAGQVKLLFPGYFNSLTKFALLVLFVLICLYIVGYIDKRYRFLHEDNVYLTETNPLLMQVVENTSTESKKEHG